MMPDYSAEQSEAQLEISLTPRTVGYGLSICIAVLTALNLFAALLLHGFDVDDRLGILRLFNFNAEANIPTLYQTLALCACAALLFVIWRGKRREGNDFSVYWLLLAIVFLYLAFDEGAELHELATAPARLIVEPTGIFRLTWIVIAAPIVAMFGFGYLRFLAHLPSFYKAAFVGCAALYLAGALGVEMLGGVYLDSTGAYDGGYALVTTAEELLEKAGIAAFCVTLVAYARDFLGGITISLKGAADLDAGRTEA